ncbi:MAG TPA: hypothetical protein DCL68_01640 [Gammaproteobacteria bacterium]|nr:hypothetical protein [Gammaproteobacteria bacterium]|tara:strand:+ start:1096 stop:1812 length:717 start_codon:yes stop_codon:yes gene_type:complete
MNIGLKRSMRAWHRWLGLFTSIQLLLWTVSGLFFTVPDITDVRGEQYRLTKDNLEIESSPKNLAPIQSIIKNDSDFMDEDFKIILKKRAQSWVYEVQSSKRKTKIFNAFNGQQLGSISQSEAIWVVDNKTTMKPIGVELINEPKIGSEYRGRDLPIYRVRVEKPESGVVYIDPTTGDIMAIRTKLWRAWDFLWSLHIMDYRERDDFSHWLIRIFAALSVLTVVSGIVLWIISSKLAQN